MATPKELIAQANKMIDEEMDNADWLTWFNDAIDDLSEVLFLETISTLTTPDSTGWFALPSNFKAEILVQQDSENQFAPIDLADSYSIGYKVFNRKLKVQNGGTAPASVELYYYYNPTYFSTSAINVISDIPDKYLEAVVLYGCMRALQSDDEDERYQQFKADYLNSKAGILRASSKAKPRRAGNWKVIR